MWISCIWISKCAPEVLLNFQDCISLFPFSILGNTYMCHCWRGMNKKGVERAWSTKKQSKKNKSQILEYRSKDCLD